MTSPALPTLDDYDAIAEAVMETARGRWFLAEFARRNRSADTALVLGAVAKLEERLTLAPPSAAARETGSAPLAALAAGVARLRDAIESAGPQNWRALASERLAEVERLIGRERSATLANIEPLPELAFEPAMVQLAPPRAPDRADPADDEAAWRVDAIAAVSQAALAELPGPVALEPDMAVVVRRESFAGYAHATAPSAFEPTPSHLPNSPALDSDPVARPASSDVGVRRQPGLLDILSTTEKEILFA